MPGSVSDVSHPDADPEPIVDLEIEVEPGPDADRQGLFTRMARGASERVMDAVDVDMVLEHVDINALLERVDINALLERVDLDAMMARIDIEAIVETGWDPRHRCGKHRSSHRVGPRPVPQTDRRNRRDHLPLASIG